MPVSQTIYLVAHGWHTGVVIAAQDIGEKIPQLQQRFSEADFLEFGWGDQRYFQTDSEALADKLRAVLIPSQSTLHVVALNAPVEQSSDADVVIPLSIEDSNYRALVDFIKRCFYVDEKVRIIQQIAGRYGDSQFYRARDLYHLFNTCNKWTAKALRVAGVSINPTFKFSAESVLDAVGQGLEQNRSRA